MDVSGSDRKNGDCPEERNWENGEAGKAEKNERSRYSASGVDFFSMRGRLRVLYLQRPAFVCNAPVLYGWFQPYRFGQGTFFQKSESEYGENPDSGWNFTGSVKNNFTAAGF